MSFPAYPVYKDSGVDWLGEIPKGGALSLFGSCFGGINLRAFLTSNCYLFTATMESFQKHRVMTISTSLQTIWVRINLFKLVIWRLIK